MKPSTMLALSSVIALVMACQSGGDDLPEVDCKAGSVPTYAEVKTGVLTKCTTCHSSQVTGATRASAPTDVNFDTYAAAKAEAKQAAIEVDTGAMPIKGYPVPSAAEKDALYKWALCGTPD